MFSGIYGGWAYCVTEGALKHDVALDVHRGHGLTYGDLGEASIAEVEGGDPVGRTRTTLDGACVGDPLRFNVLCRLPVAQSMYGGSPCLVLFRPSRLCEPPHVLTCLFRCSWERLGRGDALCSPGPPGLPVGRGFLVLLSPPGALFKDGNRCGGETPRPDPCGVCHSVPLCG